MVKPDPKKVPGQKFVVHVYLGTYNDDQNVYKKISLRNPFKKIISIREAEKNIKFVS